MEVDVAQLGAPDPTRSGPKSFNDVAAIMGDDERTDHIPGCLDLWEEACRTRGKAATKAKAEAVEIFVQADEAKVQPSWVRQWISLVYSNPSTEETRHDDDDCCSMSSLSTDSTFDGPYPAERYALFLHYYSNLRLDPEDTDGSALLVLNVERKRIGIGWTLEGVNDDTEEDSITVRVDMTEDTSIQDGVQQAEGLWEHGEMASGDTTAHDGREDMEMDIEVPLGTVSSQNISPPRSLSDFMDVISPTTSATGRMTLERTDHTQREKSPSPAYGTQTLLSPPSPLPIAVSMANSHRRSSTGSELSSCLVELTTKPTPPEEVERMEGVESTTEDTRTPFQTISVSCAVRGPSSIYDLEAIMSPAPGVETAHIREKLLQWKQVEWLQRETGNGRPTRQKDSKSERKKEGIARELRTIDAPLVQPSWGSQWIQFVFDSHDPQSRHLISYDSSFLTTEREWCVLLHFFALLMEDTHERREEALTLLNNERKERNLNFTLELPKEMEKEFKKVGASVDLDVLMQIERMVHPISVDDSMDKVLDSSDLFPAGREVPVGGGLRFGFKKGGERHIPRGKKRGAWPGSSENNRVGPTQTMYPSLTPWNRPVLLPFVEPAPSSSNPAKLSSKYADMLLAIGKPEPQEPHVWARSRSDLYETAPYFRQAQAGIHLDKQTRMIGYLLDGYPSPGDIWARDGRLIVSHGGGGAQTDEKEASKLKKARTQARIVPASSIAYPRHVSDQCDSERCRDSSPKKGTSLACDQSRADRNVRNLILAKNLGVPIVLLVGSNYRWWPLRMVKDGGPKHSGGMDKERDRGQYAVLGWYRVRDAWEELEPGTPSEEHVPLLVRCKFAFEWVEAQGTPWWVTDAERAHANWLSPSPLPQTILNRTSSPRDCFSKSPDVEEMQMAIDLWGPVCYEDPPGLEATYVCPSFYKCAKCLETSPIIYHEGWFCTNAQCSQMGLLLDGRFAPELTLSYSQDFIDRLPLPEPDFKGLDGNDITPFLEPTPKGWSVIPRYREDCETYERGHWNGRCCLECGRMNSKIQWNVWMCASCDAVIEHPSYTIYPLLDFLGAGAKGRLTMPGLLPDCSDDPGTILLYAHLENGGDIYIVRTSSVEPFESMFHDYQEQALSRDMFRRSPLKQNLVTGMHTKHFQHNAGVPYNFSCQVTTESFEEGPPVVKQARDLLEETASGILNRNVKFNEVLSCAYKKEQSMSYHSDNEIGVQGTIAALSLGSPATMTFRLKPERKTRDEGGDEGMNEEAEGNENEGKVKNKKSLPLKPPPCLGFRLLHGDILIMDGIGIQQNYQHQVIPEGLRFAATARFIDRPEEEDPFESPRRWKPAKPRRKKKSDVSQPNPPGLIPFPPSSTTTNPAAVVDSNVATTPADFLPNPPASFNMAAINSDSMTLTNPDIPITNAPDFLFGSGPADPFNSST